MQELVNITLKYLKCLQLRQALSETSGLSRLVAGQETTNTKLKHEQHQIRLAISELHKTVKELTKVVSD